MMYQKPESKRQKYGLTGFVGQESERLFVGEWVGRISIHKGGDGQPGSIDGVLYFKSPSKVRGWK